MKKTAIPFMLTLVLGLGLIACQPQDHIQIPETPEYLAQVIETRTVDSEEFFEPLRDTYGDLIDPIKFMARTNVMEISSITYHTVDPKGQPVLCAGLICVPKGVKPRGVIDMSTIARVENQSGITDRFAEVEILPTLFGYITLIPDLMGKGFNSNTLDVPRPTCFLENNGRVAYDFHKAAEEFLLRHSGYVLPKKTTVLGYSLGGTSALAMARYIQLNDPSIEIEKIIAGGGPYDLEVVLREFAKTNVSGYVVIPQIIVALDYWYDLNLDYTQIFSGRLLENDWYLYLLDDGIASEYEESSIHRYLGSQISEYMHPDFFKPLEEQNAEFQKLHAVMRAQSHIADWTPEAPLYLYHSPVDNYVPYACAQAAYDAFRSRGAKVSINSMETDHLTQGVKWIVDYLLYFLLK